MEFVQKINQRIKAKPRGEEVIKIIYFLMADLHQPYSEIMKLPIPVAMALIDEHKRRSDIQEKEMKKGRRKR